ncbi:hypothetical protein, partial [Microbacterium sp.]|uniref:hypothetical protein n=1 Tax=Microbacterium sp. TaxID=51671 RepID=UPI0028967FFD
MAVDEALDGMRDPNAIENRAIARVRIASSLRRLGHLKSAFVALTDFFGQNDASDVSEQVRCAADMELARCLLAQGDAEEATAPLTRAAVTANSFPIDGRAEWVVRAIDVGLQFDAEVLAGEIGTTAVARAFEGIPEDPANLPHVEDLLIHVASRFIESGKEHLARSAVSTARHSTSEVPVRALIDVHACALGLGSNESVNSATSRRSDDEFDSALARAAEVLSDDQIAAFYD